MYWAFDILPSTQLNKAAKASAITQEAYMQSMKRQLYTTKIRELPWKNILRFSLQRQCTAVGHCNNNTKINAEIFKIGFMMGPCQQPRKPVPADLVTHRPQLFANVHLIVFAFPRSLSCKEL